MSNSYEIVLYQKEDGTRPWIDWFSTVRDMKARLAMTRRIERMKAAISVIIKH